MKKIINILAKGDGWEKIKEITDKPVEERGLIYGVNDAFLRTPEVDVTFHMHDLDVFSKDKETASSTKLCIQRAKNKPEMRFISIKKFSKIPHCEEYPLQEIIEYFKLPIAYITSGIEYMIAYALMEGVDVLNYFGCNMTVKQEYIEQKPGMEFWTGMAMGMGVEVNLQLEKTSLLKTKDGLLYGYNIRQFKP